MKGTEKTEELLALIREGKAITRSGQIRLVVRLSIPAIVAQLSYILMQYIDAAMVGSLGAGASASIGLVSTTTWLFWGLCTAMGMAFSVQVAHQIGSGNLKEARAVLRQGIGAALFFSILLALVGIALSGVLPRWLGGEESIRHDASLYFLVFSLFLPVLQMNFLAGGMLRCSGNMRVPSQTGVWMCVADIILNFFLIFPSREILIGTVSVFVPGADLGVAGAALGTALAETFATGYMGWYLFVRSSVLRLTSESGSFLPKMEVIKKALHIGLPMGLEHIVICGAQIMTTVIVAPLGIFAIAANSFAITAESLCYMPGYGIADAATTLAGQSYGAGRFALTRRFAFITVGLGMAVMGIMGVAMYVWAPHIIGLMTPVPEVRELGVMALRIEAFAEPMFAASIVSYGVFVGVADTLVPCLMNFVSIWAVRHSLAALLAPSMGLKGVWIAMCVELCFRGGIFLCRLCGNRWIKNK